MKKINIINAISLAEFKLNKYTTENGAIIFDASKEGKISNSYVYNIGHPSHGHIDIYVDKTLKTINSIWFVDLKSNILYEKPTLKFLSSPNCTVPFFDISIWGDQNELFARLKCEESIEVYHNGMDCIYISFGGKNTICSLNENISLQFNLSNELTGIYLKSFIDITKLIALLQ